MKIVEIKEIEECLEGTFMKEILLDDVITRDFIFYLGDIGTLQYFYTFARPFFKVTHENYEFKGVEGNRTIRLLLKNKPDHSLQEFQTRVSSYSAGA
jgi:hypothetical protein